MKIKVALFLCILLLLGGIYAAGSSAGEKSDASIPNKEIRKTNEGDRMKLREACDAKTTRADRIKCRLQYMRDHKEDFVSQDKYPEVCRNLVEKEKCRSLYERSHNCYEKKGIEKNKCFKKIVGFARAKLKDEDPAQQNTLSRDYVVLLLYDLQEKIEQGIENEKIDVDKGSAVVDKITEIKEAILAGKKKEEIKPMFHDLRNLIKDMKEAIDETQ